MKSLHQGTNSTEPKKCLPLYYASLAAISKSAPFPLCNTPEDDHNNFDHYYGDLKNAENACPKSCTTFKYTGKEQNMVTGTANETFIPVTYWFSSNETEVYEEYLVYDLNGLVGSIGGTLGLFIGFSFHDLLKTMIHTVKTFLIRTFFNPTL